MRQTRETSLVYSSPHDGKADFIELQRHLKSLRIVGENIATGSLSVGRPGHARLRLGAIAAAINLFGRSESP